MLTCYSDSVSSPARVFPSSRSLELSNCISAVASELDFSLLLCLTFSSASGTSAVCGLMNSAMK